MPQVSKVKVNKELDGRIREAFYSSISTLKTPEAAEQFLKDLLTPTEITMLSKRLAIAILLEKDYQYREISQTLKVSFATINKVRLWLELGGKGFKEAIGRILKEERLEKILDDVDKIIYFVTPPRYGHATKTPRESLKRTTPF